jgi:hypothetical protein
MIAVKAILFPLLAGFCWAAFFYKLPDLRVRERDPALLALLAAFAIRGTAFFLATPRVAAALDQRTGITNFDALGVHLGGVAFGAAVLIVTVYWANDPGEARRRARWILVAVALVMMTMFALWIAANVGVKQRSSIYLLQNVHRPLVAIYLFFYVATQLVALCETARLCFQYASSARYSWLRRGLRTTAFGALIYSIMPLNRAFSIVAVQVGLNPLKWEVLVPIAEGIGIPLLITGLTIPAWGPHLSALSRWCDNYRTYRRLYPLWRDLYQVVPRIAIDPPSRSLMHLRYRLHRRVIEIYDGLLALRSYKDPEVRRRALQCGREAGFTGDELRAAVAAAQLKAALTAKAMGRMVPSDSSGGADDGEILEFRGRSDLTGEAAWLARIARAYMGSPTTS